MTLKKRAPLLSNIKLCTSFHRYMWIHTGVTARKRQNLPGIEESLHFTAPEKDHTWLWNFRELSACFEPVFLIQTCRAHCMWAACWLSEISGSVWGFSIRISSTAQCSTEKHLLHVQNNLLQAIDTHRGAIIVLALYKYIIIIVIIIIIIIITIVIIIIIITIIIIIIITKWDPWPLWLDPWPLTLTLCMDITFVNCNNSCKFQDDTMTGTLSTRCDRRTDRPTDRPTDGQKRS